MALVEQCLTRGLGAAMLYIIARDSHSYGRQRSDVYAQSGDADALARKYMNTRMMGYPANAPDRFKQIALNRELNNNNRYYKNSIRGYFSGMREMLTFYALGIVAAGLATFGKHKWLRIPAALFAVYGMCINYMKEYKGIGYHDDLNSKFLPPSI